MNDKARCKIFQKLFLACLLLVLVGCMAKEAEVRTVRVEVPVQVPCKTKYVPVPYWATTELKAGDSLEIKVRALLAERRQRIGYQRQLEAGITSCM